MNRFIPAAFGVAGAVLLGLCAGNQARLISESDSAPQSAAAALPFVFFAGTSAALLAVSAASVTDRWES